MSSSIGHGQGSHEGSLTPAEKARVLDAIASIKRKLRSPHYCGSGKKVVISKLIEQEIWDLVKKQKRVINLLLVGPAGAGKSSLANTLAGKYVSGVEPGVFTEASTRQLESTLVKIPNGEDGGDGYCTFRVWDTPGFTGIPEEDEWLAREIESKIPYPDLVILCFDISAFGGRRLKFIHDVAIGMIMKINNGALLKRCSIAITKVSLLAERYELSDSKRKGNLHETSDSPAWHMALADAVSQRRMMWKNILTDCGLNKEQIGGIPVSIFGRMEFTDDVDRTPCEITPIGPWGRDWLKESWAEVMGVARDAVPLFMLLASRFNNNPDINPDLRRHGPDVFDLRRFSRTAGDVALTVAVIAVGVGLAPFTAGLSVGPTIGGVAVLTAA